MFNQLELISDFQRDNITKQILDLHTVFLGDVHIYLNPQALSIHAFDYNQQDTTLIIIESKYVEITKDLIAQKLHRENKELYIGYNSLYIDALSDFSQENLAIIEKIKEIFILLKGEWDEFIDYINYNLFEYVRDRNGVL